MKCCPREIGEIVRYSPDKNSPASQSLATAPIAPKICQGQPPTMCSECSRFHPNGFIFGGVTAERVNTAKLPCKVNAIFGRSLSSSFAIVTFIRRSSGKEKHLCDAMLHGCWSIGKPWTVRRSLIQTLDLYLQYISCSLFISSVIVTTIVAKYAPTRTYTVKTCGDIKSFVCIGLQ